MNKEQELFFENFEKEMNDKVLNIELAELRATKDVLELLNLKQNAYNLWGLIVFAENKKYFYIPARDASFAGIIIRKKNQDEQKAQILCLSDLENFSVKCAKKSFFSFLNPENARTIFCSAKLNGKILYFSFICSSKAQKILDKFSD